MIVQHPQIALPTRAHTQNGNRDRRILAECKCRSYKGKLQIYVYTYIPVYIIYNVQIYKVTIEKTKITKCVEWHNKQNESDNNLNNGNDSAYKLNNTVK